MYRATKLNKGQNPAAKPGSGFKTKHSTAFASAGKKKIQQTQAKIAHRAGVAGAYRNSSKFAQKAFSGKGGQARGKMARIMVKGG